MWEMLDSDFDCGTECGGPGPPPEFLIPPPPRPPYLHELSKCSEDPLPDIEMCEAIPILDPSYHTSPSYQASAIILLCSVLLIIIVLSSLIVWKHKKRVQNFLPCKTPTRGGHLDSSVAPGAHLVTYEDPDTHLGRRPLVMHHHHTMEMLHPKAIHFPSGYPMPRTPPLFVCSSPGPDPYRSHDNVYEELGPPRDSDADSEPALHSDDDFAGDELSLPDERSFLKSTSDATTVATIYQEHISKINSNTESVADSGTASSVLDRISNERNSLLSSSSSNDNRSTIEFRSSSSPTGPFQILKSFNNQNGKLKKYSVGDISLPLEQTTDAVPMMYNQRNMMTLPYNHSITNNNNNNIKNNNCNTINNNYNRNNNNNNINNNNNNNSDSNSNILNNNNNDNSHNNNFINNNNNKNNNYNNDNHNSNNNNNISKSLNCFSMSMGNSDVERRNQINNQLSNNTVSTIFRERNNVNTCRGYTPSQQHVNNTNNNNNNNIARMNLRSLDRRRICGINTNDPSCGYTEPVFHEGILYDACLAHAFNNRHHVYPYIMREFTTFRALNNTITGISQQQPSQQQPSQQQHPQENNQPQQIYSRDSSFGSDSGYSQHTQASMHGEICGSWKTNDNENNSTFKSS